MPYSPRQLRVLGLSISLILGSSTLFAQVSVNPDTLEFVPSPDHDAKNIDGTPVVKSYRLEILRTGTTTPVVLTKNLGKPSLQVDGWVRGPFVAPLESALVPGTTYVGRVVAVGSNGSESVTPLSNTFMVSNTPCSVQLEKTTFTLDPTVGKGSINVASPSGCAWKAVSNDSWLSVTSPIDLVVGFAPVVFSSNVNPSLQGRNASIGIGDQVLQVIQPTITCTYSLGIPMFSPSSSIIVNAGQVYTWGTTFEDIRALTRTSKIGRVAAAWYGETFTVDIPDLGSSQLLSIYIVDFDNAGRGERIELLDSSGVVADTKTATAFSGGQYITWPVQGRATVRFTKTAGPNAVLNAVFLSPTGTTIQQTDTTTNGNWQTLYGATSYAIAGDGTLGILTAGVGTGSVGVQSNSSLCAWTATSNVPWLTTISKGSGTGSATFSYLANTTALRREGILTIAGQSVTLAQVPGTQPLSCGALSPDRVSVVPVQSKLAGSRSWVSYQLASRTPINRITIYVGGKPLAIAQATGFGDTLTSDLGQWFDTPPKGRYKVEVEATNKYGCTTRTPAPVDLVVR